MTCGSGAWVYIRHVFARGAIESRGRYKSGESTQGRVCTDELVFERYSEFKGQKKGAPEGRKKDGWAYYEREQQMSRKVRSGAWAQKDIQDVSYIWQWQAPSLKRCWETCRYHLGLGWCLQDEAMGNPLVYSNFGFSFWNFFSYVMTFMLLIFVNNDFEITTRKGQRKRHWIQIIASRTGDSFGLFESEMTSEKPSEAIQSAAWLQVKAEDTDLFSFSLFPRRFILPPPPPHYFFFLF